MSCRRRTGKSKEIIEENGIYIYTLNVYHKTGKLTIF